MIGFRMVLALVPVLLLAAVFVGRPVWREIRYRTARKRLAQQEAADQLAGLTPLSEWLASRRSA
jgi:hypothetical protein